MGAADAQDLQISSWLRLSPTFQAEAMRPEGATKSVLTLGMTYGNLYVC